MTSLILTNGNKLEITEFYIECNTEWILNGITLHQTYINNSREICQGSYIYPVASDLIVSKLVIRHGKNVIEAQLTESEEKDSDEEVKVNERPYLGDLEYENSYRLMEFHLGNLSPKSEIKVEIVYVTQSEFISEANKYKIHIPKKLIPRYSAPKSSLAQKKGNHARNWIITLNIKTPNIITSINSNIANFKLSAQNDCWKIVTFSILKLNEDINIFYQFQPSEHPILVIQQDPRNQKNAFHLSFTPPQIQNEIIDFQPKGEFIILLDSHDLEEGEEENFFLARKVADLLIKSLPEDSYFNVVNFGNEYEKIFDKSVKCEQDKIVMVCDTINTLENMGSFELVRAVKSIVSEPSINGYQRYVFILIIADRFDDLSYYENEIINYIKNKQIGFIINTIGVGEFINMHMINEIANTGHGFSCQIKNSSEIQSAVASMLEKSALPGLSNIEICNPDEFELISPKNSFSSFYWANIWISGILRQEILPQKISVKYTDDMSKQEFLVEVPINYEGRLQSSAALVTAVKSYFNSCEKAEIIEKSIAYQVLSKKTEFLGTEAVNIYDEDWEYYGGLNYEDDPRIYDCMKGILDLQLADGHWEFSHELEELIQYFIGNKKLKDKRAPFVNLLIIAILTEKCEHYEVEWESNVKKANKWLKKNRLQVKSLQELCF